MKRITTILLALMVVLFTQCKKDNIDNTDTNTETRKVKVRCEIPLGNGTRSDFTNLMTDGSIKWSAGTERIYLAVHHEDPSKAQIVELTAETTSPATVLAFEGEVDETILTDGATYNVWYLGNSQNLGEDSYITKTETNGIITGIDGSIANQSGRLEDLGHHHIAKAEVTATLESDGSFTLPLHGTLQNQIAIAYMDLSLYHDDVHNVLKGDAIIGTNYSLRYSDGEYKFVVDGGDAISVPKSSNAFVVFFPNENNNNLRLKCFPSSFVSDDYKTYYYIYRFNDGIITNNVYCSLNDNSEMEPMVLEKFYPFNGHEYIDLNLPSGTIWAKYNVGVDPNNLTTAEDYHGELYYWEPEILESITEGDWMIPITEQFRELMDELEWTWINNYQGKDGLDGFSVHRESSDPQSPSEHIFFPFVSLVSNPEPDEMDYSAYWSISDDGRCLLIEIFDADNFQSYRIGLNGGDSSVRPVIKKWW